MDPPNHKTILYTLKLLYPKYYYYFPIYVKVHFNLKKKLSYFKTETVPKSIFKTLQDSENCCLISESTYNILNHLNNKPTFKLKVDNKFRSVMVHPSEQITDNSIIQIPEILCHNLSYPSSIQLVTTPKCLEIATKIVISFISNQNEVSMHLLETMLQNYFKTPKLLNLNDIFEIEEDICPHLKYTKVDMNRYYFKCMKIFCDKKLVKECFCINGETELSMTCNLQSYVPKSTKLAVRVNSDNLIINRCPFGYETYVEELEKCIKPFLKSKVLSELQPAYLVKGFTGTRKTKIIESVAQKFGMHLIKIDCFELTSITAAHTETKLRTLFYKCKLCSPCIVMLKNFQSLCIDNDGHNDTRLISFVQNEINNLLTNNNFPIILICTSIKDLSSNLERIFLQILKIELPTQNQRYDLLKWLFKLKDLQDGGVDLEKISNRTHSFTFGDLEFMVNQVLRNYSNVNMDGFMGILDEMQNAYSDSIGAPKIPKVYWDDIGGLNDIKAEIIKTINYPIKYHNLLKGTTLRRSGLLLYGPPGTGKTLIAKAVATECGLHFLSIKGPELLNMYVGQSESNVRQVFVRARDASPCIIFFDELDSLAPNRGLSGDSGGVMDRVVSQLLAEMDGLNENAKVFIIGATNRPDLIDPALLRPGRFDKLLYVGISPDPLSKIHILKALTRKLKLSDGFYQDIGNHLPENITGADLQAVCSNAWLIAVRRTITSFKNDIKHKTEKGDSKANVVITLEDFIASIKSLKPSVTKESLLYYRNVQKQYESK